MNFGSATAMINSLKNNDNLRAAKTHFAGLKKDEDKSSKERDGLKFRKTTPAEQEAFKRKLRKSKRRETFVVIVIMLPFVSFAIYGLFWFIETMGL